MERTTMLTKLLISNISFFAHHGVSATEKQLGGKYQMDLELWYDASIAIQTDDLRYALNYKDAIYEAIDVCYNNEYNLIETLASKITNRLLDKFDNLDSVVIRLRKLSAPIEQYLDYVEVEHTDRRTPNYAAIMDV